MDMERDTQEIEQMLRESSMMETAEPLSLKKKVRAEIAEGLAAFRGPRTTFPDQEAVRFPTAADRSYDPGDDPFSGTELAEGTDVIPLRKEREETVDTPDRTC